MTKHFGSNIIDEGMYLVGEIKKETVQFISSINGYGVTSLMVACSNEFVLFRQMTDTMERGRKREKEWVADRELSLADNDNNTTRSISTFRSRKTFKVRFQSFGR
jgi:hypothetical protein